MSNVLYGLICKNPNCKAAIVVGETWVAERQLSGRARIVFPKMDSVERCCPSCRTWNLYKQDDLQIFPEFFSR
jgi:hypothetical protein